MADCGNGHSCCMGTKDCGEERPFKNYIPVTISFSLLMAGIALNNVRSAEWFSNFWINLCWFALAYIPVGIPVLKNAWKSLRKGDVFNEFMLMGIATSGAFLIGEYPEGVAVMLFYTIGEIFQGSAVGKARRHISALLDMRPETASVIRNGKTIDVEPESVEVGEVIEVKAGGRVPLDGIMVSESASFNTAALTGESMPRTICQGGEVLAGMIVNDRVTQIKVSRTFGRSALARILTLVEDAAERKAPTELFIRRFAAVYTPIVVGLAALIILAPFLYSLFTPFEYDFHNWLYRGLVFLVISCPCALVISIPLGYFGGIGLASRNGILFKGGNYLDAAAKVNAVVMDKTGTLTYGILTARKAVAAEDIRIETFVRLAAAAESNSTHPVAKAVASFASSLSLQLPRPVDVTEIPGYGLKADIEGHEVLVGSARLLAKKGIDFPREAADIPETTVFCSIDGKYAGYIIVADTPKEGAVDAVAELKALGVAKVAMLSGDKQAIVSKIAGELGIGEAYGDLLPEEKVEYVRKLKEDAANVVAFVGDGINDAPALALSDIGMAMGALGSDVAIETADVVIQTDHPGKIPAAIRIGKMTRGIIIQNVCLAFGVKAAVLILGAYGVATLWEAVFADVGVALLAILNAARLQNKSV